MTKASKSSRAHTAQARRRRLLALLASGESVSGEQIAKRLRITRSAVWKLIRTLRELGIDIEAEPRQGYRLPQAVQLYDAELIKKGISPEYQAQVESVEALLTIDSTNRHLLDATPPESGNARICVAEVQTAGRGRRGRSWLAPFGSGVCLSVAWQFAESPPTFSALGLVVGVAVVRALRQLGCNEAQLKWPNDIVYRNRKLAGILIDMRGEAGGPAYVVIGIGLNLHMPATARIKLAEQQAVLIADLHEAMRERASMPERNRLIGAIVEQLFRALRDFQHGGFAVFEAEWRDYDSMRDAAVRVLSANESINGIARGVATDGALLVEVNSLLQRFMSGDVSLRRDQGATS